MPTRRDGFVAAQSRSSRSVGRGRRHILARLASADPATFRKGNIQSSVPVSRLPPLAAGCLVQPASAKTFTGLRVEATSGYDAADAENGAASALGTIDAARIGGGVGYDLAVGRAIALGLEAGVGVVLNARRDVTIGTSRATIETGHDIDLSARLGVRVMPRALAFVKAGYANSRFGAEIRTPVTGGGTLTIHDHANEDGLRLGGSAEIALGARSFVKGEYRYTAYEDGFRGIRRWSASACASDPLTPPVLTLRPAEDLAGPPIRAIVSPDRSGERRWQRWPKTAPRRWPPANGRHESISPRPTGSSRSMAGTT